MSDTVEQIKSRLDIVDVVSGYLKIQKAGASYKARCPFHNEKTPSFHISPERQSWHCFGCNKGGDMFSFVQEIEGVEFVEAMRILATKAGVQLPQWRPEMSAIKNERAALLAVTELAAKFFEKQLWSSNAGVRALEYLRKRGLTDDTIRAWRLGWAPNDWRALTSYLMESYPTRDIVTAGMAVSREARGAQHETRIYDRFRSRIMFPIADANGQVVGFTGRVFGAEVAADLSVGGQIADPPAKYVNTPQTPIYDKSRILFGLDKAKLDMRRRDECLLVEGNMDAIMSWQAGATHVVATSGTALTPQQLSQLARYSINLSFCFDSDQAGQTATRRGIGLALSQKFAIKILTIPDVECKDPADYVAKYGAKFVNLVDSAKPALQYYYDAVAAKYDPLSVESKKSAVAVLGPLIKRLVSKVEQSHWVGQLAALLRTDPHDIQVDIISVADDIATYERGSDREESQVTNHKTQIAPVDPHSQELLGLVVKYRELLPEAQKLPTDLLDARVVTLLSQPELLGPNAEHELRHLVDVAVMRAEEMWGGWTPEQAKAEFSSVANRLRIKRIRQTNFQLARDIEQAEITKNQERRDELLRQFQQNTHELNQLLSITNP